MKKIIRFVVICFCLILLTDNISASVNGNSTAYCVGTDYGSFDIDTTIDAQVAGSYYSGLGISTINVNIVPTLSNMNGSHANGQKYLASGIVFFSGHGGPNGMTWNYLSQGGNGYVGVIKGNTNNLVSPPYKYALGNYALSDVALYVFGGCKTAYGSSNISKWVVDNGAKISVGWSTEVLASAHSQWLSRFNYYISQGYSVNAACNYADSFTYSTNSGVQNNVRYGMYYHNPYGIISSSIPITAPGFVPENDQRYLGIIENETKDILSSISTYLSDKVGQELSDYFTIERIDNDNGTIYNCTLSYKEIRSLIGFTFMERDGKTYIYDNTNGVNIQSVVNGFKFFREQESIDLAKVFEESMKNNKQDNMYIVEQYIFYDYEADTFFDAFTYYSVDDEGFYFADCILNAIK